MSKLDTVKLIVDMANTVHSAIITAKDERSRREKEKRERDDTEKDRRIKELEKTLSEKGAT